SLGGGVGGGGGIGRCGCCEPLLRAGPWPEDAANPVPPVRQRRVSANPVVANLVPCLARRLARVGGGGEWACVIALRFSRVLHLWRRLHGVAQVPKCLEHRDRGLGRKLRRARGGGGG